VGVTRPRRFSSLGSAEMRNPGFVGKTGHEPVAKGYIALSPLKVSCQPLQVESRHLLRIPRDGERGFHGIVNTDSTAT